jgi:hypothetical protein
MCSAEPFAPFCRGGIKLLRDHLPRYHRARGIARLSDRAPAVG